MTSLQIIKQALLPVRPMKAAVEKEKCSDLIKRNQLR